MVAPSFGAIADEMPEGKGLAGVKKYPVYQGCRQGEVDGLVFLQVHVYVAQLSADQGVVFVKDYGERVPFGAGEFGFGQVVLEGSLCAPFEG